VGILEQSMLWKLLKKHEKENVEREKEKQKFVEKLWEIRSPKVEK
jgi:hypothetical protein